MATQPDYSKVSESSPKSVVKNPEDAVRIGVVLESGIGTVSPGDVFGKNADGRYAKFDNDVISPAKAIYDGQREISSDRLAENVVNEGLVFGNAVVDSSDLNVEDPASASDAVSDLEGQFIFDV